MKKHRNCISLCALGAKSNYFYCSLLKTTHMLEPWVNQKFKVRIKPRKPGINHTIKVSAFSVKPNFCETQ